jgi:hypothetical protein
MYIHWIERVVVRDVYVYNFLGPFICKDLSLQLATVSADGGSHTGRLIATVI